MRGMIIRTDELPEEVEIQADETGSTLRSLQALVGGYIEPFGFPLECVTLYVNDDGLACCPPNRAIYATKDMEAAGYPSQLDFSLVREGDPFAILHGDIVAVGYDPRTGCDRDLTEAEEEAVRTYFSETSRPGSGFVEAMAILSGIGISGRTESPQSRGADLTTLLSELTATPIDAQAVLRTDSRAQER